MRSEGERDEEEGEMRRGGVERVREREMERKRKREAEMGYKKETREREGEKDHKEAVRGESKRV